MYYPNTNIRSRKYIYLPRYACGITILNSIESNIYFVFLGIHYSILALLRRKTLIIFRVLHFQNIPIFIMHSLS